MPQYKINKVPVVTGDDVPEYVTQKMVYPVKQIGEDDGTGNVILVTTVATRFFDESDRHLKEFDKLDRYTDGEYVDTTPDQMMDLEEVVE